ncbi:MAG: hypothetical protein JO261_07770 [Alphaproteobacteria bacterium]|nr:hypothetical protein [Alphaproteobacteria bacterium]MBV9693581.1 hypothetical protein [Alphaproteobacteria bacterium]
MVAYWDLPKTHLLVLLAASLGPLRRFSDGRWRTAERHFPPEGLASSDIEQLEANGLVETCPGGALISEQGRAVLCVDLEAARIAQAATVAAYAPTQRPYQ